MSETTVVNAVKDRSKMLQSVGGGRYEYGWVVYNRRDRTKDYFNKTGEGTYEDAVAWMSDTNYVPPKRRVIAIGPGEKA